MEPQHDDAVDKVLAALRTAAPPEGMEARIAQRMHLQSYMAAPSTRMPAGSTLAGAWWRGAFSGAAAATLGAALFFFASHLFRTHTSEPGRSNIPTVSNVALQPAIATITPVSLPQRDAMRTPCAKAAVLQVHPVPSATTRILAAETRIESAAPSHPAPALPLTAEERGLVQLVHSADPKTLATLTPEIHAKLQVQEASEFDKFFSPSSAAPTSETHE